MMTPIHALNCPNQEIDSASHGSVDPVHLLPSRIVAAGELSSLQIPRLEVTNFALRIVRELIFASYLC